MTKNEFENIIAAYGVSPERWPESRRDEAKAFLETHGAQVRDIYEKEQALDRLLGSAAARPPSDLLKARILKAAASERARPQQGRPEPQHLRSPGWRIAAIMTIGAFGLGFGGAQYLNASSASPDIIVPEDSAEAGWYEASYLLGGTDVYLWAEGEEVVLNLSEGTL